jgi:pimeloyl-ACP methyl ester carboxylesterase
MARIHINGTDLEYEFSGIDSGEPVVCIHGALIADTLVPMTTQPSLAGRYRFLQYHRRGHTGSSGVSEPVSIDQQATDCLALVRQLDLDRVHLVGHSYGGVVALAMAMHSPDTVHTLAVLEPALVLAQSADAYRTGLERASMRYREAGGAIAADAFLEARWPGYRPELDRLLPGAFSQAVADAGTFFDHEIEGLLAFAFGEAEAGRIVQPALSVLGGENTGPGSRFAEGHRALLDWLPHGDGVVIPGAHHMFPLEWPAQTADVLAAFWARHPMGSNTPV